MPSNLCKIPYNRKEAIEYANEWAYYRNPKYYDFEYLGGDCTNFISQCIYTGCKVMNYKKTFGWYYVSVNDRAPAWTDVGYLYNFLTSNKGEGPYGIEVDLSYIRVGDIIQLQTIHDYYHHTVIVTELKGFPTLETVYISAHSEDVSCRPLGSYDIQKMRCIHIVGARKNIRC